MWLLVPTGGLARVFLDRGDNCKQSSVGSLADGLVWTGRCSVRTNVLRKEPGRVGRGPGRLCICKR